MKKLLIVEDDQIVANIYRNKFSVEGYQVELAMDGQAGLDMIRSFRPDAVILDLILPKMGGVELTKCIRSEPEFQKLPIIIFSNTYLTNLVQDAWKAGATKCLSKVTCTPKQILEVVRGLVGSTNGYGPRSQDHSNGHRHPASADQKSTEATSQIDEAYQKELRKNFIDSLPATLTNLRASLQTLIKTDEEAARVKYALELYRRVHFLTGNAAAAGLGRIARMCDALEALLQELHTKPKTLNSSTLRTVASSIDFLAVLFEKGLDPSKQAVAPARILVIDDEAISRRAVTYALEKANLKCTTVEDPVAGMEMIADTKFDLIFLDVNMPEMNGFELCSKLRSLPANKKTPVIFVTGLNDFECRANSTMSGGTDFIAKPFLFIELAVKAIIYVLKGQLETD